MAGSRSLAILCVAAWLAASAPGFAQERYRRNWSDHPGMPRLVLDLTYDDRGFLWLAGEEGVHRFDGQEVVPWGADVVSTVVHFINRGPQGQVVAVTEGEFAYEVTTVGLSRLTDNGGSAFYPTHDADYAGDGSLWLTTLDGLFRRSEGAWTRIEAPVLEQEGQYRVRGAPDGGAYVSTRQGSFVRVHNDHSVEEWAKFDEGHATRIAVKDERVQAFTHRFGDAHGVYLVEDGKARPVYNEVEIGRRWTGLEFRDDTLWAVAANELVKISDGGNKFEVLGPAQGFEPGGEVVVDHEKSLWLTSFRGTYQYTEPDVVLWTDQFGTRRVHRVGSTVYANRWDGPNRRREGGSWEPIMPESYHVFDWGGISPWGHLWCVAVQHHNTPRRQTALLEYRDGEWVHHLTRDYGVFSGAYGTADDGTFYIAYFDTLWRVTADGASPQPVAGLSLEMQDIRGLDVRDNRVHLIYRYGPYCVGTLTADGSALEGEWTCETIEEAGELYTTIWVDDELWIGTQHAGVLRRTETGWVEVIGQDELGSPTVRGLSHSASGGVWVVTFLSRTRIETGGEEIRIVERLGPWNGVPNWMTFNTLELEDGTLWVAGMTSAIEIPPHARQRPTEPPRVFVTSFSADGEDISPDESQVLPASTRRIELRWAAPAYRDPASLRFEVRADSTGEWVPTRERSFGFRDLGPGDYRIEVRASLDGMNWTVAPADVRFEIRSPLWQRPVTWFATGALIAIVGLLVQWQRARQQVRLERQRTEIAMNLHDELGAGLGSIGLLTDLASDEEMPADESRRVTTRVGEISRGLSRSLSDIVWTLRPASADLPGFAQFLRQRASDLLSAGDTAVEFDFPDPVPPIRIQLEVRRQIHAIASEALHNAAKHAEASRVKVGLARNGSSWILAIDDDGVGLGDDQSGSGLGLESMKKRAASIGAELSIAEGYEGGCHVELRFRPRVEDLA